MTTYISTLEAKEEFSEIISRVSHHKERIVLLRRGKEIAAIVPLEDFHILQKTLSETDLDEAMEALKEARTEGTINLQDLKDEIG